jgi:MFS family permease
VTDLDRQRPAGRDRAAWPALAVVAFGVFVAADDLMVVATMLRPMIGDLGLVLPADLGDAAWIVNVYLIAYIAVMPLAGRLSDVVGRRAVFVAALVVFLAGSIVVPAADRLAVLLVGRVLTAVGGGALVPIALAVAGDLHTGRRRARALGLIGAIETLGWVWGPLYGALLVRFASWQWQFHLNIPLAVGGIMAGWLLLDPTRRAAPRLDWVGAAALTVAIVAVNLALLGEARIQSVGGLDELRGGGGASFTGPWLYAVAGAALVVLVAAERRAVEPLIGHRLVVSRVAGASLAVNALLGFGLVIALINVPLFVNVVGAGVRSSAVLAGWLLTALTATMAVTSYLGGAATGRLGPGAPTALGLGVAAAAFAAMGVGWAPDTGSLIMAVELGLVGAGIGLVLAPTSTAIVDAAAEEERGAAAGLVIMARLIGFSVGLASVTAWGLRRYDQLRADVELPALGGPGYAEALAAATREVTTTALAETFLGAALALVVAVPVAVGLRRRHARLRAGTLG